MNLDQSSREILVLGSDGQVGSAITALFGDGTRGVPRSELDFANIDLVLEKVSALKPQILINAVAYTAVDLAEDNVDLCTKLNVTLPAKLAEWCQQNKAVMVHFSSDYVYGSMDSEHARLSEKSPKNPLGVYAKSKLDGDLQVAKLAPQHLIFRLSWVYSYAGTNFVRTILKLAGQRELLNVVGDQRGYPTYAPDVAQLLLGVVASLRTGAFTHWGTFNVTGPDATTWFDFANQLVATAMKQGWSLKIKEIKSITTKEWPSKAPRPLNSLMDNSQLRQIFGTELPSWQQSIAECISRIEKSSV